VIVTQSKKRAILTLTIWSVVLIALIVIFFSRGGPSTYIHDTVKKGTIGAFFAAGYIAYGLMMFLTRVKSGGASVVRDERDERIGRRASLVALMAVLVFVFFTCISLYEHYHDEGLVPVGWMWFLGYASVFVAYISSSVAVLVLHAGRIG
jgi:hypothetical protein